MTEPKYDVAISFLTADEPIAAALEKELARAGLKVFFYPRKQEELAGKNGLEAMRLPFIDESRIVVVLFREKWGKTPWTGVEEAAIQDGCLKNGWQRLFFIMLDKASVPPNWLPSTHIRFNFVDFGLEQAVGAIKARVLEAGGVMKPLTALQKAEATKLEMQFLRERDEVRSRFGHEKVEKAALELFAAIQTLCAEINANGSTVIEFASTSHTCHLRNLVSLYVRLDTYAEPSLIVSEFDKRFGMQGQNLMYVDGEGPQELQRTRFLPDMNRAREYGWSEEGKTEFLSSAVLADKIVGMSIDLAARVERERAAQSYL